MSPPDDPYANIDLKSVRTKFQTRLQETPITESSSSLRLPSSSQRLLNMDIAVNSQEPTDLISGFPSVESSSIDYDEDFHNEEDAVNEDMDSASLPPLPIDSGQPQADYCSISINLINAEMRDKVQRLKTQAQRHQDRFDAFVTSLH